MLVDAMIAPRALQIHPDGSCYMQQNRISGCAAWVVFPDHLGLPEFQIVDFGCEESSNNRMELMGCLKGLRWALETHPWEGVTCLIKQSRKPLELCGCLEHRLPPWAAQNFREAQVELPQVGGLHHRYERRAV